MRGIPSIGRTSMEQRLGGGTFKGLPHTPTSVNQTRTRPGMLYGHRNIAMLYGGPCLNLIYISALPHRGNWGGGGGGGRGEGPRRGKKNAIYSYSIGSPGPSSLRRSRYLISLGPECSKHRRPCSSADIYNPPSSDLSYR